MPFINKILALSTTFLLLLLLYFSNNVKAGYPVLEPTLNKASMSININEVAGWNHLETNVNEQEIINVSLPKYNISTTTISNKNIPIITISMVFVRKLANWHQQHINGIEINLVERELSFGQFMGINFAITNNHANSVQPSIEQAKDYYKNEIEKGLIRVKWLKELLINPPVLTLTLFGEDHDNQNISTPMATFDYTLIPTDGKNIVNINAKSFSYFWQKQYKEQKASQDGLADHNVSGMLLTLNTSTNKTLRSFMSNKYQHNFHKTINELFLELALSIEDPIINVSMIK